MRSGEERSGTRAWPVSRSPRIALWVGREPRSSFEDGRFNLRGSCCGEGGIGAWRRCGRGGREEGRGSPQENREGGRMCLCKSSGFRSSRGGDLSRPTPARPSSCCRCRCRSSTSGLCEKGTQESVLRRKLFEAEDSRFFRDAFASCASGPPMRAPGEEAEGCR